MTPFTVRGADGSTVHFDARGVHGDEAIGSEARRLAASVRGGARTPFEFLPDQAPAWPLRAMVERLSLAGRDPLDARVRLWANVSAIWTALIKREAPELRAEALAAAPWWIRLKLRVVAFFLRCRPVDLVASPVRLVQEPHPGFGPNAGDTSWAVGRWLASPGYEVARVALASREPADVQIEDDGPYVTIRVRLAVADWQPQIHLAVWEVPIDSAPAGVRTESASPGPS